MLDLIIFITSFAIDSSENARLFLKDSKLLSNANCRIFVPEIPSKLSESGSLSPAYTPSIVSKW